MLPHELPPPPPPEVKPMLQLAALKGEPLTLSASLMEEETSSFSTCVRALKLCLGDTKTDESPQHRILSVSRMSLLLAAKPSSLHYHLSFYC